MAEHHKHCATRIDLGCNCADLIESDQRIPPSKETSKILFEGTLDPKYEDSRMACICEVYSSTHDEVYVRVQSWDEETEHRDLQPFLGKLVRITIETVD